MPNYLYTATNSQGKVATGAFDAQDRTSALAMLAKQDLKPISLKEGSTHKSSFSFLIFLAQIESKMMISLCLPDSSAQW